jgi:hypothetical protein
MKGKMLGAAGEIEDGATVEIIGKAAGRAEAAGGASPGSGSPEYTVVDEGGHEETVNTRDFEALR